MAFLVEHSAPRHIGASRCLPGHKHRAHDRQSRRETTLRKSGNNAWRRIISWPPILLHGDIAVVIDCRAGRSFPHISIGYAATIDNPGHTTDLLDVAGAAKAKLI